MGKKAVLLWAAAVFVLAMGAGTALAVYSPAWDAGANTAPAFLGTVTEVGGHLAFQGADGTQTVYDTVYTYLLPEEDREALRRGVPARDGQELEALLEDYGL